MTAAADNLGAESPPRPRLRATWPLLAGAVSLAMGSVIGQDLFPAANATGAWLYPGLAVLAATAGPVALARIPTATITTVLVALATASALVLGLAPFEQDANRLPLILWVNVSLWRYALTPLMVHFGLRVAWPHRIGRWYGPVLGLYLLHSALWATVLFGRVTGDATLLNALDGILFQRLLEPAEWLLVVILLLVRLADLSATSQRRRAVTWGLAAIVVGSGPFLLLAQAPALLPGYFAWAAPLTLGLLPWLALAAALALPRSSAAQRDLLGLVLARRITASDNLSRTLDLAAEVLCDELEGDGLRLRLLQPPVVGEAGDLTALGDSGSIPPAVETLNQRRIMVAPIGRPSSPLGELRISSHRSGAFGRPEREWLAAVLEPISSALRARYLDARLRQRLSDLRERMGQLAHDLTQALAALPEPDSRGTAALPGALDIAEPLGQLDRRLEALLASGVQTQTDADQVRDLARVAGDEIALALDAVSLAHSTATRITQLAQEIIASNETVSEIAFRTNLLANNAALEATRSGGTGRTFGVLAEEIRRLADGSASTSSAIEERSRLLTEQVGELTTGLTAIRSSLDTGIHQSEQVEDAARKLADQIGQIREGTRRLTPSLSETRSLIERQANRNGRQESLLTDLLDERLQLAANLADHRLHLQALQSTLLRLAMEANPVKPGE